MEKLPMCRICLVKDVCMYVVVNKNLHELYEKLTDVPFVTEDSRPMLACFFCCTKLKQCWRLQRKCLEAEELFTQMLNDDYEGHHLFKAGHFFNGFSNSAIELISIVDGGPTECEAIKEELTDVSEGLDGFIDPEKEDQTVKSEIDCVNNSYPDVEDTPALHDESDSEDAGLMEVKTEMEVELELIGAPVAYKADIDTRRSTLVDTIPAKRKKNENFPQLLSVLKIMKKTQNRTSKRMTKFKEPITKTQHGVNSKINNTALGTNCYNSNKEDINRQILNTGIDSDGINRYRRACGKEKHLKCDMCPKSFYNKNHLTSHIRTHTGEKPFKCDICQRSFNQKNSLVIHILNHTGEKPFKCDVCHRGFNQNKNLVIHTRTHTGEKPFKCDICQRSFAQKGNLVSHTRTHTGEKPFKCDLCQRSFTQKNDMISHTRTHTGEKPFKCDVCQRSFGQKSNLVIHTRIHTGEKPFKCDLCQRCFTKNNALVKHTRTHTIKKPFKCDVCQSSFCLKRTLVKHTLTHI